MNSNCKHRTNGSCDLHKEPDAFCSDAIFVKATGVCYANEYGQKYGLRCPKLAKKLVNNEK